MEYVPVNNYDNTFLNNICITWACHMKRNFVIPSDSAAIRRVESSEFL